MASATHHERTIERLRAALAASQAQLEALRAATAQHIADHPDPVIPSGGAPNASTPPDDVPMDVH